MSATLRLHRKLYTASALRVATEAFSELATIAMEHEKEHYSLTFSAIAPDVQDVLVREFANYALAETIESRR
jgi:hypothetical protein